MIFGDNWVQYGYMFYGHYDGTYSFYLNGVVFDYPLAYFLTIFSVFLLNLVAIVIYSAPRRNATYVDSSGSQFNNLIFGNWDFREGFISTSYIISKL